MSTSGDVYSFGILVLEMCTRKRPTDEMFGDETSLTSWVRSSLNENTIVGVVDQNLMGREDENLSGAKEQCLLSILSLAMECAAVSPVDRIRITQVVVKLDKIRSKFLAMTTTTNYKVPDTNVSSMGIHSFS